MEERESGRGRRGEVERGGKEKRRGKEKKGRRREKGDRERERKREQKRDWERDGGRRREGEQRRRSREREEKREQEHILYWYLLIKDVKKYLQPELASGAESVHAEARVLAQAPYGHLSTIRSNS